MSGHLDERPPCPLCGEVHQHGPFGVAGGPFEGIEILTCPQIPQDCVYTDDEFPTGPRGRLIRVQPE